MNRNDIQQPHEPVEVHSQKCLKISMQLINSSYLPMTSKTSKLQVFIILSCVLSAARLRLFAACNFIPRNKNATKSIRATLICHLTRYLDNFDICRDVKRTAAESSHDGHQSSRGLCECVLFGHGTRDPVPEPRDLGCTGHRRRSCSMVTAEGYTGRRINHLVVIKRRRILISKT